MNQYTVDGQKVDVNDSLVTGSHNLIFGDRNKIIGDNNKVYGNGNMVFGNNCVLKGASNSAEGAGNILSDPFAATSFPDSPANGGVSEVSPQMSRATTPMNAYPSPQPTHSPAHAQSPHSNPFASPAPSPQPYAPSPSSTHSGSRANTPVNNPFSPPPTHLHPHPQSHPHAPPFASVNTTNPFSPPPTHATQSPSNMRSRAISAPPTVQHNNNPYGGNPVTTTPPPYNPYHPHQPSHVPTTPPPTHQHNNSYANQAFSPPSTHQNNMYFQPIPHQHANMGVGVGVGAPTPQPAYVLVAQPIIVNPQVMPMQQHSAPRYEEPTKSAPQKDLITDGTMVFMINEGADEYVRDFCVSISRMSGQRVGSHLSAGRTCIVGLGDLEKIRFAIISQLPELNARLEEWSWEAHGKRVCADRNVYKKKMFKNYTRDDVDCWRESNRLP